MSSGRRGRVACNNALHCQPPNHSEHTKGGIQEVNRQLNAILHRRIFALDARFEDGRVAEDEDGRSADEPEEGAQRGRPPQKRQTDHE
jgi:hypothetical protein